MRHTQHAATHTPWSLHLEWWLAMMVGDLACHGRRLKDLKSHKLSWRQTLPHWPESLRRCRIVTPFSMFEEQQKLQEMRWYKQQKMRFKKNIKRVTQGYHNPPLAPASPTLWLEWPVTQLTASAESGFLTANTFEDRAFRTVNCKIQLPASVSVNLLSFKLGASWPKSPAARSLRKSSATNPKWWKGAHACLCKFIAQPNLEVFCSTGLQTW